ncbi:class I SAM-dependent methyltransferase [Streptomyces sp. P38-E01]|uniref:Class I SAM-dependent methyltransferase n=1 Tax=Streptomyces tardus TaxID=2780544 RepID=A0A949N8S2_9ACTN|nr:class I SAM-dependent methyltransferase [Streptomyces tardus]MBU7598203.1 class I SAM-dependent methyltransferase [Streptomyces tardus]
MQIVNPALDDYLNDHSSPADELLRDLAEETRRALPDSARMQVSQDEAALLTMLTQLTGAQLAVEVGTFTGYSSIAIARGLAPGGRLIACDVSEEWTSIARRYWERAGVDERIDLRIAPAADTLRALPAQETVDFAFIDADKVGYPVYYEELVTRLRPGGLIALDNVLQGGLVVDESDQSESVRAIRAVNDTIAADERVSCAMLPVRDGVTLVRKL